MFLQRCKYRPKHDNLTRNERKTLKEIKNIKDITILPADKGGIVVIMNHTDYVENIEQKLNEDNTYEIVKNPTNIIMKSIAEISEKLFKQNKIKQRTKMEFNSIEDLPRIKGQPKIHKPNNSMRLITCTKNTILSPISNFILNIIKELRKTIKNSVNNTTQFVNQISKISIDKTERLASLDIQDMYTNIPITRAVGIIINQLDQSEAFKNSTLTKSDMKRLLLLALNNNYVEFNNKYYKQKHGLPMDSCLSPIIADMYIGDYINKHLNKINRPQKLWRYVDDIIIITTMNKDELNNYVNELNNIKSKIKFTLEYEDNNKLNFLDTTITRNKNDNKINIKWYRKPTASNTLLNYNSCHHKSVIKNISINNLEQQEDVNTLVNILKQSDYPQKEIQHIIKNTLSKHDNLQPKNKVDKKDPKKLKYSITVPYTPGIEILKRKLMKLNIDIFFSYPNKLRIQINPTIHKKTNSVIYQIECSCGATYVGETKTGLTNRIKQHEKLIKQNDIKSNSELVIHTHNNKHQCQFNTSSAIILDRETNWKRRRTKESIYSTLTDSINKHDEIDQMWLPLILINSEPTNKK